MNKIALAPGMKGFDADGVIKPSVAKSLWNQGYRFVARYVRRVDRRDNDLGPVELSTLLSQGFGVFPVQHVEPGFWTPTLDKARTYGDNAALAACELGFPKGVSVGLDLESVAKTVSENEVIDYCNLWFDRVSASGYEPLLYVGFQPMISGVSLYSKLKFRRYWKAFNLNADQYPSKRGFCLAQKAGQSSLGFDFDENISQFDDFGGYVTVAVR